MYNISIVGRKLVMKKSVWASDELFLAQCLWWEHDGLSTITADLEVTLKKSIKEFLNMAFPTFMKNPTYEADRKALTADLKKVYGEIEKEIRAKIVPKIPYWDTLYSHQKETVIAMHNRRATLLAFQQRVGKSGTMMSHSLATGRKRTVIVCMDVGKWNYLYDMTDPKWNSKTEAFSRFDFTILDSSKRKCVYAFNEKYVIINYEALEKYLPYLISGSQQTDHIVLDECFTYNTLITTDKGNLPIGYIVENAIDCKALSVNYKTGNVEFKQISAYISNPINKEIVLVKTSDGCIFTCTNDHKIFVHGKGYVKAKDLQAGRDMLYSVRGLECKEVERQDEAMEILRQEKDGSPAIVRVVSVEILERGSGLESEWLCGKNKVYDVTVEDNHNYFANGILVSNCQAVKNIGSARHKNCAKLIDALPDARITLMSGTPVMNRLDDMFAYFRLCHHPLGESKKKFDDMFTRKSAGKYSKIVGSKNSGMLFSMASNFMVRKRLDECSDIPTKSHVKMYYPIGEWKDKYNEAIQDAVNNKGSRVRESCIHAINNIMAQAKVPGTFDFVKQLVDQGEKVVVFTSYTEPLNRMGQLLDEAGIGYVRIDGSMDGKQKVEKSAQFTNDENTMVAICNMKAAGHSINLSVSSFIVIINYPLSPMELDQAIFRTDTVDKTRRTTVYYSMCVGDDGENTVDMRLSELNESKIGDINNFVDKGKDVDDILNATDAVYSEILKQYANENKAEEV